MLENRIKEAFGLIHAEESLKEETKKYVYEKVHRYRYGAAQRYKKYAVLAACFLFCVLGAGGFLYFTPVSVISIDVNPSLELEINGFDRIICVKGYNEDGEEVAESVHVQNMVYSEGISLILKNNKIVDYIENDEVLEVTVCGPSEKKNKEIEKQITQQTGIMREQIYCTEDREELETAHEAGLSCGKYRAYLELQEVEPEITVEEIKNLSMKQIKERIREAECKDGINSRSDEENGYGNSHCQENENSPIQGHESGDRGHGKKHQHQNE